LLPATGYRQAKREAGHNAVRRILMTVSRLIVLAAAVSTALMASARVTAQQRGASVGREAQQGAAAPRTAGNIERGRYLVTSVAMCGECHSTRDARGNIVPGTEFGGGPMPVRPAWGIDWPLQFPRIKGMAGYTDEEAMRLLTQGAIKRDGTQLRLPMPRFRMNPQDAADVIAFLRSI
jgi:hypothetical protein